MMRPLGPGMMQQIQQPCSHCNQTGYSVPNYDMCGGCHSKVAVLCLLPPLQHSLSTQSGYMLPCLHAVQELLRSCNNVAVPVHTGQLMTSTFAGHLMF